MENLSRRRFLLCSACLLGSCLLNGLGWCQKGNQGEVQKGEGPLRPWKWSKEAYHYNSLGKTVICNTCPHLCVLDPRDRGICRSKVNIDGKLLSLAYGNPASIHIDPMEKKPLFHFYPGAKIFSVGLAGCNLRCLNCQNWELSQKRPEELQFAELFPDELVKKVEEYNLRFLAFTYSEPISFYEYVFDVSARAREAGIKTALISNGYINPTPLRMLSRYLDAANINLKSFSDSIYLRLNGGRLDPVLATLKTLHEIGVWLEITTLMVPTYVEDMEMIKAMAGWILKNLGPDHPHHFSRFFPQYRLTRLPPTPVELLERAREVAMAEGIKYVYIGNVPGHDATNTYCHSCKRPLVIRKGYDIKIIGIKNGRCTSCKSFIPGRWEDV